MSTQVAASTINWPSKAEAALALGVSTKTVEKYVADGKLRQSMQSQINKPARVVIDPETVEKMLSERSQVKAGTIREGAENSTAMVFRETLRELFSEREPSIAELAIKIYLTEDEAVRYTGLGRDYLRRYAPKRGKIGPRGSVVYCRKDLELLGV